MKILLVSMNSIHFERWTNQLKDSGHEVYWFNINDSGYSKKLSWVKQISGWKLRYPKFRGRTFIKKNLPFLYKKLSVLIENNLEKTFDKILNEIKPDVVHSFVLYVACVPIFNVMQRHNKVKWIYSSWGSDLYYFQNEVKHLNNIKKVLPRINYLFTDCNRDLGLAKKHGFKGVFLGVFPGGGGYSIDEYDSYISLTKQRDVILVKGYQGRSGRAIQVLKALEQLSNEVSRYKVIVFGADKEVVFFLENSKLKEKLNLLVYPKDSLLEHIEIIKLMGKSLIYIGNSNSDGMPNTLLEAVIMGAFPIQSNPGGASSDVIENNKNGLLIKDCDNSDEIAQLVKTALESNNLIKNAFHFNQEKIKPNYDRELIAKKVVFKYNSIAI